MEQLTGTHSSPTCRLPDYWKMASQIWVDTISQMCVNFDYQDAPWEYLERTNSAILAGCLSAAGASAMPETYVMRNGQENQQAKRVDICLVTRSSGNTVLELVECKQAEYDSSKSNTYLQIQSKLNAATKQVSDITGIHGIQLAHKGGIVNRTSVVFGLPCFQPEPITSIASRAEAIQKIINDLQINSGIALAAWCFPREYSGRLSIRYKKYYPGTFLVVKAV